MYTDALLVFNIQQKDFHRKKEALVNTLTNITKTISPEYVTYILGKDTPWQALRALQGAVAPDPTVRIFEVDRQYKALCAGLPRGQNVKQWLVKWEQLYAEATSIGHADVLSGVILNYFIDSVSKMDPSWAETVNHDLGLRRLRREATPTFMDLLNLYRQVSSKKSESDNSASSYAATLQGQPSPRDPKDPRKPVDPPTCVCGTKHWYAECKYVMKSIHLEG